MSPCTTGFRVLVWRCYALEAILTIAFVLVSTTYYVLSYRCLLLYDAHFQIGFSGFLFFAFLLSFDFQAVYTSFLIKNELSNMIDN